MAQLIAACQRYIAKDGNESARKHVTIEYVMLEGVNDQPEHAQQLLKLLKNLPSKINLIPFNPFLMRHMDAQVEIVSSLSKNFV